jgi:thioredoxin reductase (NADPH)
LIYDLIIIGAGPAGLSAAIHAKRFGLNFLLLEKGVPGGQARAANLIENYPGLPLISGGALMDRFLSQMASLGIDITKTEIKNVSKNNDKFILKGNGSDFFARSVILATGLKPINLNLKFEKSVHYYPDPLSLGHDGRDVLVVGGGDSAFDEAISFAVRAKSVTIAIRGVKPKATSRLVERAMSRGVKVKTGINEAELVKTNADIIVACCGKQQDLSILDRSLQVTQLQIIGDLLHPDIRYIAAATGDGVCAVERIVRKVL